MCDDESKSKKPKSHHVLHLFGTSEGITLDSKVLRRLLALILIHAAFIIIIIINTIHLTERHIHCLTTLCLQELLTDESRS